MPKETVYDTHYSGDSDEVAEGSHFKATVGWRRDGVVQIATTKGEDDSEGWYVTLDRGACNRLVRALRKARDQTYGSDA